jgi:hypothetical protein
MTRQAVPERNHRGVAVAGEYTDVELNVTAAHVGGNLLCAQQGTLRIPATMSGRLDGVKTIGEVRTMRDSGWG